MFNFQPQTHKPMKPGFLLAAIAGILMLVFSLVQAPTVSAIAYKDMTPSQQAKSWAYTNAVQWCIKNAQTSSFDLSDTSNQSRITPGDAASGKWWQDSWNLQQGPEETVTSTYLHGSANSDGVTTCNNVLRDGAQLWGYGTDFMSLMCDITGTRANSSSCSTGNGDFGSISGSDGFFRQKINDKVYGGSGVTISNPGLYWLYYSAFTKGCQAKITTIPAGQGNGDMIYRDIKTVDDKGEAKTDTYEGISKGEVKRIYVDDGLYRHSQNCGYIADRVNEYAPALAAWHRLPANKDKTDNPGTVTLGGEGDSSTSSCRVDGIGWIICPALGFMSAISDQLFSFLASEFLSVDTRTVSTTSGTHEAWSIMRNIANVAFVIAFLVIIFSQLTSVGINAYGIKKMLPRLIISAVLVNLSFIICQLAVDLSNIFGYGLKALFDSIQINAAPGSDATGNGFGIAVIVAAAMAGGITLALALSVPVVLSVLLALLVIVFILLARKALIVLLIVIAPLAFVAYLLPNTEQWYKKWQKMFFALLLVFPVISVVFGASTLAAKIIKSTAAEGDNLTPLIAVGVAAIPLVIVPSLLKGSIAAAGAIGATMKGWGDKSQGKIGGKIGGTSRLGQYSKYRKNEAEKRRALIQAGGFTGTNKNPLNWSRNATSRFNKAVNTSSLSGKFGNRSAAMGVSLAEKIEDEEVGEAQKLMRAGVDPHEMIGIASKHLEDAIDSGDVVKARAAQQILLNSGNKGLDTLHDTLSSKITTRSQKESEVARNLRSELNQAGLKGKNNALAAWSYNSLDATLDQTRNDAGTLEGLSDTELAGQSFEKVLSHHRTSGAIGQTKAQNIIDNQNIWKDLSKEKQDLFVQLAGRGPAQPVAPTTPPTAPPPPPTAPPPPPTPPVTPPTPPATPTP